MMKIEEGIEEGVDGWSNGIYAIWKDIRAGKHGSHEKLERRILEIIATTDKQGYLRGVEDALGCLPKRRPMGVFSFFLTGEEKELYSKYAGWNSFRDEAHDAISKLKEI